MRIRTLIIALALVLTLAAASVQALDVPPLKGRVNDYAGMISPAAEQAMDQTLADLERTDSTQVAVLTVPSLEGESLEEYSLRVAETWGLGGKDKDNGVLLLVSKGDRMGRIEVGYGLEGRMTDLMAGRIIDQVIIPAFKAGRFDTGFVNGVQAIAGTVRGEYKADSLPAEEEETGIGDVFGFLLILFLVSGFLGRGSRVLGGVSGLVLAGILALALPFGPWILLLFLPGGFLLGLLAPLLMSGLGGPGGGGGIFWGGGFGSGGGSGGGFGGFSGGGGGFGGGGASGGW